jgi:hypothetical protein
MVIDPCVWRLVVGAGYACIPALWFFGVALPRRGSGAGAISGAVLRPSTASSWRMMRRASFNA